MGATQIVGPRATKEKKQEEDNITPAMKALTTITGAVIGGVAGGPAGAVEGAQYGSLAGGIAGGLAAKPGSRPSAAGRSFMDLLDLGLGAAAKGMERQPAIDMDQDSLQKLLMAQAGDMPADLLAPEGMGRDQHWANMVSADPFLKVRAEQRAWDEDPENKFAELEEWMTERDFDPTSAVSRYEQMPSYAAARQLHHSKSPYGRLEQTGYTRPSEDYLSPDSIWSYRAPAAQPPRAPTPTPEVPSPGLGDARLRSRREPEPMAPLRMPQKEAERFGSGGLDLQRDVYSQQMQPQGPQVFPGNIPMDLQGGALGPQALDAPTQAYKPPGANAMLDAIGMSPEDLESWRRGRGRLGMSFGPTGGTGGNF